MAIQKIQYTNKEQLVNDTTINDKYKCKADDLNEIKSVVNNNADEIPSDDNLVNVGTSVDNNYRTNILSSRNILDVNTLTIDTFTYNDGGSRIIVNNYIGIEFINVKPNTTYTFSATLPSQYTIIRYVQFNNSKTFISRSTGTSFSTGSVSFTTGNNCYYIAILCYKTTNNASTSDLVNPMLNEGSTALSYEPFIQNTINVNNEKYTETLGIGTSINDKNRVNILYSKNLFKVSNVVSGKGINADNSTYDQTTRSYLDYTEVKENTTYMIGDLTWKVLIFLNSSKQVISSKNSNKDTPPFTTPSNCKYIRISFDNSVSWQSGKIQEGTTTFVPSINVDGEEIYSKPVVLYDNPSGTTGDAILNDIPTNYKYIEIFYNDDQLFESSLKIKGSTHPFVLSMVKGSGVENAIFLNSVRYTVVNNTLKYEKTIIMKLTSSGIAISGSSNVLKIYQVLGYK